jgi:hypothetical protein
LQRLHTHRNGRFGSAAWSPAFTELQCSPPIPLELADQPTLRAAEGYVELGMPPEANEELEQIDADVRHVPEVLAM